MATIHHELRLTAHPDQVWDVVRDLGAVHRRFAPGFVTDTRLDGNERVVTFVNGVVVREAIVTVDDDRRRLAYAVVESPLRLRHHHASFEVVPRGGATSLLWTADVLPDEAAAGVAEFMNEGVRAIGAALGSPPG